MFFLTDRLLAIKWMEKLNSFATKLPDLEKRNKVLMSLIVQSQIGKLSAPFSSQPNFNSLDQVPVSDMKDNELFPEDLRLPIVMQNSPDHGAFLVSQPIPKCGAFAYIAVVSRPNK